MASRGQTAAGGVYPDHRDRRSSTNPPDSISGSDNGRAVEARRGEGNFSGSASPSLVHPPGMATCPPRLSALANASRSRVDKHPAGGLSQTSVLPPVARIEPSIALLSWPPTSSATPVTCAASTSVLGGAPGGASKAQVGTTPNSGRGSNSWSKSRTNFASLPPSHPNDSIETKITKISALNALLLHAGAKAEAEAAASGLSCGTLALEREPAFHAVGGGTSGPFSTGEAGEGGFTRLDNGPLPSITRLVEAGALLSGAGEGGGGECRVRPPSGVISPRASVRCD